MATEGEDLVLLLRSVNVGGNRMRMAWLRELVAGAGGRDVRTLLATGNVLVARPDDPEALRVAVERALAEQYGGVDVLVRTPDELAAAVVANPWAREVEAGEREGRFVHTMFLREAPDAAVVAELPRADAHDAWELAGREVFLSLTGSSRESTFGGAWFERRLGVGTMRNHNTVRKVLDAVAG